MMDFCSNVFGMWLILFFVLGALYAYCKKSR
jgi:cbb3-type cytochrome oxidase subunit 3